MLLREPASAIVAVGMDASSSLQAPPGGSLPPAHAAAKGSGGGPALLTLEQTEERILHLLTLASTVTSALAEVHPDSVADVHAASRDFSASVRLIYASLLAHIRAHSSELSHLAGGLGTTATAASAGVPQAAQAHAAAIVAAANEFRRNVYLDAQAMQVEMENLDIHKERIWQLQQQARIKREH